MKTEHSQYSLPQITLHSYTQYSGLIVLTPVSNTVLHRITSLAQRCTFTRLNFHLLSVFHSSLCCTPHSQSPWHECPTLAHLLCPKCPPACHSPLLSSLQSVCILAGEWAGRRRYRSCGNLSLCALSHRSLFQWYPDIRQWCLPVSACLWDSRLVWH